MPHSRSLVESAVLSAALVLGLANTAARAETASKTITLSDLQTMVSGLGFTDSGDKKTYISLDNQSKHGVSVSMQPVDDGQVLSLYANLGEIPAAKADALPGEKMLEYNDTHRFYFSVGGDTPKYVYLGTRIRADSLTPQVLRQGIDQLVESSDETADLWNQDNWTSAASAPAPSQDYAALQAQADAAWEASPLKIVTAVFAKDRVPGFGDYTPRADSVFKNGEVMHLYVQPIYYDWKPVADQKVALDLSGDLAIKTKTGSSVLDAKDAIKLHSDFASKIKTVDMTANVTLEDSLAATDYVVTMTVHDNIGKKVATVDLPFSIAKP